MRGVYMYRVILYGGTAGNNSASVKQMACFIFYEHLFFSVKELIPSFQHTAEWYVF